MASSTARLRNRSRAPEEYVRRAADDDLDTLLSAPPDLPRPVGPVEQPPVSTPGGEDPGGPASLDAPGLPDGEQGRGQEEEAGPDLSRFTPRDRTRGLSAALPNDLDVALAAYELDEAKAGRRRTRIAIVEEAIGGLPDDLDGLVALVAAVAPCLDPDAPARGFSVRVRPEVVEHLDHLALRLYRDRGLRRVTHRALAIAALSQLLHTQPAERTPTEP